MRQASTRLDVSFQAASLTLDIYRDNVILLLLVAGGGRSQNLKADLPYMAYAGSRLSRLATEVRDGPASPDDFHYWPRPLRPRSSWIGPLVLDGRPPPGAFCQSCPFHLEPSLAQLLISESP
jgi:hypothetical protein